MGGNNTHRMDWFSCYPFAEKITEAYVSKGETVIGGSPVEEIKKRFSKEMTDELLALRLYDRSEAEIDRLLPYLCSNDFAALKNAVLQK